MTVARLQLQVGCGRNTFYEHFDDINGAVQAACHESGSTWDAEIRQFLGALTPRTPGDAITELSLIWAAWSQFDQARHWKLLERFGGARIDGGLLTAVAHIHGLLVSAGGASGVISQTLAAAVCGALRAIVREVHQQSALPDDVKQTAIADTSREVLSRLLR